MSCLKQPAMLIHPMINTICRATWFMLAIFGTASLSHAQEVFIPDTNLRVALNEWVPGAVDPGGYLDTGIPAVLAQGSLTLNIAWTPADLTGVDALNSLTSLSIHAICYNPWSDSYGPCDSVNISIPAWPVGLHALELDHGTWTSLPPFPLGLDTLDINVTGIPEIPTLPGGIISLSLVDKPTLTALPDFPAGALRLNLTSAGHPIPDLPVGLTYLVLHGVPSMLLPALPNTLDTVYLSTFGDTAIGSWPPSARLIDMTGMENLAQVAAWPATLENLAIKQAPDLAEVPAWPINLLGLQLWYVDALASLPQFPPGLETIGLLSNGLDTLSPALESLPPWPTNIRQIFLASMDFTELPSFPAGLQSLDISYLHQLTCLPVLPEGLQLLYLDADGLPLAPTSVTCLPNFPPNATVNWGGFVIAYNPDLLCTSLNSTCDFLNPVATGAVYWDQNANGARDAGEAGYPFATLHQQPGGGMHGVDLDGTYTWPMAVGNYTISAGSNNPYVLGTAPAQHSLAFSANGEVSGGNDFGIVLQPGVQDLRVDLQGPFGVAGFVAPGTITCENVGTVAVDAVVTFQLDDHQTWVGSTPVPTSVMGNTVTWDLPALQVGETRQISLTAHTDASVTLGDTLLHAVELGPVTGDQTPTDNVCTYSTVVVGSFDPNDKLVQPETLTPAQVAASGSELIYTVWFQNTGNWPAVKVVIVDSLSPDLQRDSFRKVSSSHPCTWELSGSGVLTFTFDPIDLPDSAASGPESQGFVKFAIKPVATLVLGNSISNVADIYFDFNAPVHTAATVFTVNEASAVAEPKSVALGVYPNPAQDALWVDWKAGGSAVIEVFDVMGRAHIRKNVISGEVPLVSVQGLAPGPYSLRCTTGRGTWTTKFLKR